MDERARLRQSGQGMVEYGLLVLLISVVIFAIFWLMGSQFGAIYSSIGDSV